MADAVEVGPSRKEGLGLFARRAFATNDFIHRVRFVREITADAPLRTELGERPDHCAYPDGRMMLVAYPHRHMNHSCDPNAYYEYEGTVPVARSRRAIEPGEEITVDYLVNNAGGDSWPCRCGAARCRGKTGTSFFELPKAFQREYLPLLAPWFRVRFADRVRALEDELAVDAPRESTS